MTEQQHTTESTGYDFRAIEAAWPSFWAEQQVYAPVDDGSR